MREEVLPDELWERLELLLPVRPQRFRYRGRRRAALERILYAIRTGIDWNGLPTALAGEVALCPWEWLQVDFIPEDWAEMMKNFGVLLGVRVGIKHVSEFRVTVAVNALSTPPDEEIGQAIAEFESYRDHDDRPPSRQALLLKAQHIPRLITARHVPRLAL